MGKKRRITLVTFGSTQPIPEECNHCNACGGDGRWPMDRRKKCRVCRGKGYWNEEDIQLYHKDCTEESCFGSKYGCGVKHQARLERELKESEERLEKILKRNRDERNKKEK